MPASSASGAMPEPADDGARIVDVARVGERTRDLTIDSPAVGTQRVRLIVPRAFEADASRRWPVLYLLHGASDTYISWTRSTDVEAFTARTNLLVVMPEGGDHGYYSDWWNAGNGGPPMWETFHTVELRQLLDRNWRAADRRVIAGLSMGGMGAMAYAARHPALFLAAASYSGVLDTPTGGVRDPAMWGNPVAQAGIWREHNPTDLAPKLRGIPLYVSYGDGRPGPLEFVIGSDELERRISHENEHFLARLRDAGIPVTVDAYGPGTHSWPYWERALHRSMPLLLEALGERS
jgi:diacylglycerol O-acyltransferase / trehalose O-mycolyltransferase / mycolyltransferase Ag85